MDTLARDKQWAFIGAGNMAEAIARAALGQSLEMGRGIIAADLSEERRAVFESMGIETTEDAGVAASRAAHVLLAVKPQVLPAVANTIAPGLDPSQLLVSIMAGVSTSKIEAALASAGAMRVVRVMPNTPMMVGCGMSVVVAGAHAKPGDAELVAELFAYGGEARVVENEAMMDAVTAVSGSGPAYLFYLAEAMEQAANQMGMDPALGRTLTTQTLLGAATMLARKPLNPSEYRAKVTSPGGTTQAATEAMDAGSVKDTLIHAILAAEARGQALGQG